MPVAASRSTNELEEMTGKFASLRLALDTLHVAGEYGERVLQYFAERVCSSFCELMHTLAARYRKKPYSALGDAQLRGEYV